SIHTFVGTLLNAPHVIEGRERIVTEDCLTVYVFFRDQSPISAVTAVAPVIAHDEIMVLCDFDGAIGRICRNVCRIEVWLIYLRIVDKEFTVFDLDLLFGQSDNAFDIRFGWIIGEEQHDDVPAFDRFFVAHPFAQRVEKLVDKDTILIVELRHHALAFDAHWLNDEYDNEDRNHAREHDIPQ